MAPHTIDVGFRMIIMLENIVGNGFPTWDAILLGHRFVGFLAFVGLLDVLQEVRVRGHELAVTAFVENDSTIVERCRIMKVQYSDAYGLLIARHVRGRWGAIALNLTEVRIYAPEVGLHPLRVERVIVALHALRLQAEEEPSDAGGHWHGVELAKLITTHLRNHLAKLMRDEIDSTNIVALTRGD